MVKKKRQNQQSPEWCAGSRDKHVIERVLWLSDSGEELQGGRVE
jgi:hypothetical protein